MNQGKEKDETRAEGKTIPVCPHCKVPLRKLECCKTPFVKRPGLGYPAHTHVVACPACHMALGVYPL